MPIEIKGTPLVMSTSTPSDFDTLNSEENLADYVYYAKNSYKYGTSSQVISGDAVGVILAKKGDIPLTYAGNNNLAIINSSPVFTKLTDKESYITALNLPDQMFSTPEFSPSIGYPREIAVVLRVTEGQSFEQFQDAFETGDGFGDNGTITEVIAGINQPTGFYVRVANQNAIDASFAPFYTKMFVQVSYEESRTRLWINGVFQGESANTSIIEKKRHAIFVGTNNADQQWFAQYHYLKLLSDSERISIANSIINKWDCDDLPQYPYAHNIKQSLSSGVWSATFLSKNPSGGGVNLSSTQYRWIINIRKTGGFELQKVIATSETITNSELLAAIELYRIEIGAATNDSKFVYVAIKVFDDNGFGWEYFRGTDYTAIN